MKVSVKEPPLLAEIVIEYESLGLNVPDVSLRKSTVIVQLDCAPLLDVGAQTLILVVAFVELSGLHLCHP